MSVVEIYTTPYCGYCVRAKRLLNSKGVSYREIDLHQTPGARKEMTTRAPGARTVPQIFIDNVSIGGCDELYALERAGRLDPMLSA